MIESHIKKNMNKPFIFKAEGLTPDQCFCYYANITYRQAQIDDFTDEQYDEFFAPEPKYDALTESILKKAEQKARERKRKLLIKHMHDKPELKEIRPVKLIKFTTPNIEILKKCNINLKINKK